MTKKLQVLDQIRHLKSSHLIHSYFFLKWKFFHFKKNYNDWIKCKLSKCWIWSDTCNFFCHFLKKITTTGSIANFLSPNSNGQGSSDQRRIESIELNHVTHFTLNITTRIHVGNSNFSIGSLFQRNEKNKGNCIKFSKWMEDRKNLKKM